MGQVSVILGLSLLFIGASTALAVSDGRYAHPELIIQPEELKDLLDQKASDIRIIDVREKLQYLAGHIPGAVQLWRPDIEDEKHPLPGMMASQAKVEEVLGNLGIGAKDTLIIYSDLYDHTRLWWILAYYGFPLKQLKLLDGGIVAWKAKGYPLKMIPTKVEKKGFTLGEKVEGRKPLLCTLPEVKSALEEPQKVVLDVRSKREYLGEDPKRGAARGGHIPGAIWIEWKETLIQDGPYEGYWKPAEEIKKIFAAKGITPDKDIYIY